MTERKLSDLMRAGRQMVAGQHSWWIGRDDAGRIIACAEGCAAIGAGVVGEGPEAIQKRQAAVWLEKALARGGDDFRSDIWRKNRELTVEGVADWLDAEHAGFPVEVGP